MISLRILGTEEAKNELASLGEDVDDFVVQTQSKIDETVRSYTAVASNAFQGISVLDENGNYRSTYEILRDISLVYQEILDADKKAGTNRGQALLEVLAGKNRSNVAASILQSPELLTSVYEETMKNAQGSVEKELESQLQSIESHLNQLKNAWDKLWVNENNREVINFFLDLAKGILEVADNIGVLNTAFIGIGAGIGIKNVGNIKTTLNTVGLAFNSIKNISAGTYIGSDGLFATDALKAYATQLSGLTITQQKMALMTTNLTAAQRQQVLSYMAETAASKTLTAQQIIELSTDQKRALINTGIITGEQARTGATITLTQAELKKIIADETMLTKDKQLILSAFGVTEANLTEASSWEILGKSAAKTLLLLAKNPLTWVVVGVVALTAAYANLASTAESAAKAQEKLKEVESNLVSARDELTGINDKIIEIKSNGGHLGISDQAELDRLETERGILEDQVRLLELKKELAADKSNREAIKAVTGNKKEAWWTDSDDRIIRDTTGYTDSDDDGDFETYSGVELGVVDRTIGTYEKEIEKIKKEIAEWESKPDSDKKSNKLIKLREKKQEVQDKITKNKDKLIDIYLRDTELMGQITEDDPESVVAREKLQKEMDFLEQYIYTKEQLAKIRFDDFIKDPNNKAVSQGFKDIQKDGEITAQEITDLANKFPALSKYMSENGITAEVLVAEYAKVSDESKNAGENANKITSSFEELNKELDNIQSAYQSVQSAIEEYNKQGYLSVDAFQSLMELEPQYLNMLMDEEGNLNLTTDALYKLTSARIDELAIKQAESLIDTVTGMQTEESQLKYLKSATDDLTASTWDLVYAKLSESDLSDGIEQNLRTKIDAYRSWAEAAKAGIGKGGLSSSSSSSAKDTAKNIEDINEKLDELNKQANLDNLKYGISSVELSISKLENTLDSLSESFDKLFEGDYIGKQDILAKQFETAVELGKQYRQEFERLAQIQPTTADEANELASRLETLGSSIRENAHSLIEYTKQLNELRVNAITGYGENVVSQLSREFDLIDRNLSALTEGSVLGDSFSFDFLFPSIPESAIEKQRKTNEKLVDEEEKYNDEIYKIKKKALDLEQAENAKAREKEKQELIKSLNETQAFITKKGLEINENVKRNSDEITNQVENTGVTIEEKINTTAENIKTVLGNLETFVKGLSFDPNLKGNYGLSNRFAFNYSRYNDEVKNVIQDFLKQDNLSFEKFQELYQITSRTSPYIKLTKDELKKIFDELKKYIESSFSGIGGGNTSSSSTKNPFAQYGVTSDMQKGRVVMGKESDHKGVDYGLPMNTPVPTPVGGIVRTGIDPTGFGNYVVVTDSQGYQQWFGHLSKSYTNLNGKSVKAGTIIGLSGSTGRSTGAHLHYEIRTPDDGRLHPDTYLAKRASGGIVGKGETTLVNELGQESAILPNGKFVLLGNEAKLIDMPIGTQVINHEDTADILKYTGKSINNTKIQKLADGNTDVTVGTPVQDVQTVTINADSATVNADESKNKELEAWIEKYTSSSSYDTYSMEFHQKYSDYLAERDKRISNLDALKEQQKEYDEGSLEYETLGRIINAEKLALNDYVSETLNNLSLEMTRETTTKLESARNDLLWEYKQSISRGDSAEILKELQDGIAEIDDKIAETNDKWLSGHEKIREEIIETADRAGDVFDAATKKIEKNIDRIDHKLNMLYALDETPKPIEEHAIYQEKNKAYQESIINNEAKKEKSHVLANDLRRKYSDVINLVGGNDVIDALFDAGGEIIQSRLNDLLATIDDSEMKQRTKTLVEGLSIPKQDWHTADDEIIEATEDLYANQKEFKDKFMDYEQQAHDTIVEMINDRKEKELEAVEEIHEEVTELLEERKEIIEETYERQLELLQDVKTEEDYQRELNEETDKLNQIQQEIDKYSLIDTNAARTKVSELQKQLQEQQDVINEKQRQKEYDDKVKALEEDRDLMLDSLDQKVEDENDAYDKIKEAVEERYTEEKVYAEATAALISGKLDVLTEKTITSYDDIGTKATLVTKNIEDAWADYCYTTGTMTDSLRKNEIAAYLEDITYIRDTLREIIDLSVNTNFNFGEGTSNSADGSAWEEKLYRLKNEAGYATSEILRAQTVIADYESKGLNTNEQYEYLYNVAKMEKERALDVIAQRKANGQDISEQEDYLKFVCDILGESIPKYHTGKIPDWLSQNEELSIIKRDELILTKPQTQALLDKLSNMTALSTSFIPNLSSFAFKPPIINNVPASSVGDVNVTINVPEGTKINKQLLNDFGTKILDGIRTELKVNI